MNLEIQGRRASFAARFHPSGAAPLGTPACPWLPSAAPSALVQAGLPFCQLRCNSSISATFFNRLR
jgi:hypothetical protein